MKFRLGDKVRITQGNVKTPVLVSIYEGATGIIVKLVPMYKQYDVKIKCKDNNINGIFTFNEKFVVAQNTFKLEEDI
jgi:ribosomal protein L21E